MKHRGDQEVKVAILAGGQGTRISGEMASKPKPLVEIGGQPILWHVMKHYASYGFYHFLIALGHKGGAVRDWAEGLRERTGENPWIVEPVDTGAQTQTGGRIKRLEPSLGDATFMLTWCDGLSNVNLMDLLAFHRSHGKLATVTAVHPPPRFGHLALEGNRVTAFREKPPQTEVWINGAFFVLEPGIFEYIAGDDTEWEREPLEQLTRDGQFMAYRHTSFWRCMDTVSDQQILERLWQTSTPPWKTWE